MKKILLLVFTFLILVVNTSFAQQHNKGVSGVLVSGSGFYTSSLSFGGDIMYSYYLNRKIALQGGAFFEKTSFLVERKVFPVYTYGVEGDILYLLWKKKGVYFNLGVGVDLGMEDVSRSKEKLEEYSIVIENLKNKFSLGIRAKMQTEFFIMPSLALIVEGKGAYRPVSSLNKFVPGVAIGVKVIF